MKKIIYSFGVTLALFIASCTDFVDPAIPYSDFETGTYLRTLSNTPNVNFFALPAAQFSVTVEAVDAEDGKTVKEVDVFAARRRGATVTPEVKIGNIPASEFKPHTTILPDVHPASGSKYPAATFTIGIPAVLQALGLTEADMNGGDFFEFRLVLTTNNGRTFTNTNLSADVSGGAYYRSPFFYRIPVVCPSDLAGTFAYETVNIVAGAGGDAAACGGMITGSVTIGAVAGATGSYTISDATFGQFACAWGDSPPGGTLRFNDACGKLSFSGVDKYGDSYTFTFVSNDGQNLVFDWLNTYGDGGRTTLKANAGKPWPAGLR